MQQISLQHSKRQSLPQLAGSAKWSHGRHRLDALAANGLAIEIAPDPSNLQALHPLVWPYIARDVKFRYHGFFPGYEIGDADQKAATEALLLHQRVVDVIADLPAPVITCHVGLTKNRNVDLGRTKTNLRQLVCYAESKGVVIALENLKAGPTADPAVHLEIARSAGAKITLDLGHAVSGPFLNQKTMIFNYIDQIGEDLAEVHYYEKETDRHYAPQDMQTLGPIVTHLLNMPCDWWTIELESLPELYQTMDMTIAYLSAHREKTAIITCLDTG